MTPAKSSAAVAETSPPKNAAPSAQTLTIDQALGAAYAHWNAGQVNQAEQLCQKILAEWPGNSDALHLLGLMSHNWGNLDLALDYLRKACQTPRAPAVYFSNLAEMCRQKGLLAEGEAAARRAVAMDATLVGGWNNLGIILQEAGKLEEALSCLQRVIAAKPDYAEAYNNLGNTFKRIGQLDKAQLCYAKALELSPNYPEAHSNLSNLLKEFGKFDQALAEARRAIELNPRLADAYINAAAAETARLRHEEALLWLNKLLTFAPNNALGLAAKAGALQKLDVFEESLKAARAAVAAAPQNGDAYNALGQSLQALNKYDEAGAAFDKATTLLCTAPEQGFINKGVMLMEINRPEEAKKAFAKAVEVNPRSASAYFNAVDLKTYQAGDADIDRMEAMLNQNQIQILSDRTALHFALGKAYMDAGDDARAFAHLNQGNRMKRETFTYDAETTSRWLDAIAEAFPASYFKRTTSFGAASDKPVFIVGLPRSGTTLLEQILASHPAIHGAGELSSMRRILGNTPYPDAISALSAGDADRIGKAYVAAVEAIDPRAKRVVDKMPANFLYAGLIAVCLPGAKIIHCRRNPVDTCLSCYTKLFSAEQNFTYDLAELGKFYCAYDKLMKHWKNVLSPKHFIEVDYESVVSDLETEARRMIAFCGLPWNDACMKFYKSERPIRTASVNQVRQPIYKRSVNRGMRYAPYLEPLLKTLGISPASAAKSAPVAKPVSRKAPRLAAKSAAKSAKKKK